MRNLLVHENTQVLKLTSWKGCITQRLPYLCQGSNPLEATNMCCEFEFHSVCHTRGKRKKELIHVMRIRQM